MKKTLILLISLIFVFPVFSQKSISDDIFEFIKSINSIAVSKKIDIDNALLNKNIQHLPGVAELNQLIKDFEANGKWIEDDIVISDELKPYINVKGNTLIYMSGSKFNLETAKIDLKVKAYLQKTEEGKDLDVTYYLDYSVFGNEGKELLSFKTFE